MWSWIPILGPFIQAALNAYAKHEDVTVQKTQIAANKEVSLGAQDVTIIQTRAQVAKDFAHDVGIVFARDLIVNWYAIYISLIFYDSCFRNLLPDWMTWRILAVPSSLEYLCAGIVAFLFVSAWRGK